MDIRPHRMVHLGHGKFWRSDEIVGLTPIDEDRGPGRRTYVWVTSTTEPIVASRSEQSIMDEMTSGARIGDGDAAAALLTELLEELEALPPVIRKLLVRESGFDSQSWEFRLRTLLQPRAGARSGDAERGRDEPDEQEDLFADAH